MPASPSLLPVPASMDATWLEVINLPAVVVLGVVEPLPHNMSLVVEPLGFLAPVVLCCITMLIQKPYIELGYRSIWLAALYQRVLLPLLLKITAC